MYLSSKIDKKIQDFPYRNNQLLATAMQFKFPNNTLERLKKGHKLHKPTKKKKLQLKRKYHQEISVKATMGPKHLEILPPPIHKDTFAANKRTNKKNPHLYNDLNKIQMIT